MTEIPPLPMPEPAPASTTRSRHRLILGVTVGLVVAAAVVAGILLAVSALNAKSVALYTSDAEHYSVKAPGKPTQQHLAVVQPLAIPATASHWTDGRLFYSVSSADGEKLPPTPVWRGEFLHDVLVDALLNAPGVSASSLKTDAVTNAFLTKPDEVKVSGETAYAFKLTVKGAPAPFHVVFTGHGSTLYMLVYSDSADSRDENFLHSFTYLD